MATVILSIATGIHQKILETIVKVEQCEQCNSSGELK